VKREAGPLRQLSLPPGCDRLGDGKERGPKGSDERPLEIVPLDCIREACRFTLRPMALELDRRALRTHARAARELILCERVIECRAGDAVDLTTNRRMDAKALDKHTSELQSPCNLVCRLLLEKKKMERRQGM